MSGPNEDQATELERGTELLQVRAGWGASLRAERASGDRRVTRRAGEGRRMVAGPGLRRPARISVISTLVALAVCLVAAASASAFTAQGSAKQVYVTGLDPNAQASLLNSKGKTVYTQNADSLGGLLFRNVAPGTGYRVRLTSAGQASGPLTVHSERAAPWDPSIYDQTIPDNGYTYLTTRDGTQLAIDVHPPSSPAGEPGLPPGTTLPPGPDYLPPYPTLIEYSGYGYAEPAGPNSGQAWAYQRIQDGDTTCAANQVLHGEAADLGAKIAANSHYVPAVADPLDPVTFVHKIDVPVFMACQWEDEQTGGHCPTLAEHMTGTTKKWFTFTNGAHIDSLDPETYNRWYDFLEIYVARQAPAENAGPTDAA